MTAEFQFAHFFLVHHKGEYMLWFYKDREQDLFPLDYEMKSAQEQREVWMMLPRRAALMVTLTREAAYELLMSGLENVLDMPDAELEAIRKKMVRRWVQAQSQDEPQSIAA